mmetsp:Transcript_114956/g.228819  ORF Transcript_114956/g.228819 Transcript_114956/m.228819 type:complete len:226 (+) Transcript_114956:123-800(+)
MTPSLFKSTSSIAVLNSSFPTNGIILFSSSMPMVPLLSLSRTWKAARMASSEILVNDCIAAASHSVKSSSPEPSESSSSKMSSTHWLTSVMPDGGAFSKAAKSSAFVMTPLPSVSMLFQLSRKDSICSPDVCEASAVSAACRTKLLLRKSRKDIVTFLKSSVGKVLDVLGYCVIQGCSRASLARNLAWGSGLRRPETRSRPVGSLSSSISWRWSPCAGNLPLNMT